MQNSTLQLFHKTNSRSQRIIWLFEELQLPYELCFEQQLDTAQSAVTQKYPTVKISNTKSTFELTESSAITEYFCQKEQRLIISPEHKNFSNYCLYKNFADASFMPNLALKQVFSQIVQNTPWPVRFISLAFKAAFNKAYLNPELQRQLQHLEQHLQLHPWLAGNDFSTADLLLWFPLYACQYAAPQFQQYDALNRYLRQIESRPAFQQACAKGQWSAQEFQRYWQITQ